jgi:hypothetical protein
MLFIAIIAGAALIAMGIVVAVVLTRPSVPPIDAANPAGTFSGAALAGTASAAAAAAGTAAADPAGNASATADNTPPPPGTGNATGKPGPNAGTPAKPGTAGAVAVAAPKDPGAVAAVTPPPPKTPEPAKDLASALANAAGKPAEAAKDPGGGGSSAPFDRGAASAALGGVAVQSCKKPDGPTGSGHVKITFAPNGTVSSAVVDSGPFPGTAVGGCIAGKFRGAHVPPFSGGPVSVGKSFAIN